MQHQCDWAYISAELGGAMGTMTNNPEDCGGAWGITLELATFLGRHSWRVEEDRSWAGCELVGEGKGA